MTYTAPYSGLPDPAFKPEFYADVTVKRALAWVVDTAIIAMMCIPVIILTGFLALFVIVPVFMVISFIYRTVTLGSGSATWGMRFFSVEIRNHDGTKLTMTQGFLHTLGYSLSISMLIVQLISIGLMFTTARGQGLTDMVLGTVGINKAAQL